MTQELPDWWLASARTITLELTPSALHRRLACLLIASCLTLWVSLAYYTRDPMLLFFVAAVGAASVMELRVLRDAGRRQLAIRTGDGIIHVAGGDVDWKLERALCLPWLVVLRCRRDRRSRWQQSRHTLLIWRDSLSPQTHRALRRWLRQRQAQGEAGTTGSG